MKWILCILPFVPYSPFLSVITCYIRKREKERVGEGKAAYNISVFFSFFFLGSAGVKEEGHEHEREREVDIVAKMRLRWEKGGVKNEKLIIYLCIYLSIRG